MRNVICKRNKFLKRKKEGQSLAGSYTVEMAILFPMILGVLLFSLGLTFYLYDLCVLDISANLSAMEGRKFVDMSESNRKRKIRKLAEEEIENSLIAMQDLTVAVQVKGDEVSVTYEGKYTFPIINLFFGGNAQGKAVSIQAKSVIQDAEKWIRMVRKTGRIVDYIKGRAE